MKEETIQELFELWKKQDTSKSEEKFVLSQKSFLNSLGFYAGCKATCELLSTEFKQIKEEMDLAYQVLEAHGVSKERAKTVANGIDVLESRYRKDRNGFECEKQSYFKASHDSACEDCKIFSKISKKAYHERQCEQCKSLNEKYFDRSGLDI